MIKFITKVVSGGKKKEEQLQKGDKKKGLLSRNKKKKEPKGGQYLCFGDSDASEGKREVSWTKCKSSLESLAIGLEFQQEKYRRSPSGDECTDTTELGSSPFHTLSTEFSAMLNAVENNTSVRNLAVNQVTQDESSLDMSHAKISPWSRHAMINKLRFGLHPLARHRELDNLAQDHAKAMAKESRVFHSNVEELCAKLSEQPKNRLGENVFKGKSQKKLDRAMTELAADYTNLIDPRYTHMGLGVARDSKGVAYQCILLQG